MERDDTPLPRRLTAANDSDPPSIDEAKVNAALVRIARFPTRGALFATIEDETGLANGILWPNFSNVRRLLVKTDP